MIEKRICLYNEATVATGSTICNSGITLRCENGEWHSLTTTCSGKIWQRKDAPAAFHRHGFRRPFLFYL
jgi:hypothetical protein